MGALEISSIRRFNFDRKKRPAIGGEHRLSAKTVGRPAEYNTFGKYAGDAFLCSRRSTVPIGGSDAAGMGTVMRRIAMLSAIALVACTDKGTELEKQYEIVKRTGSRGELCDMGRKVADFYLSASNEEKYKNWDLTSDIECQLAELTSRDLPATEGEADKHAMAEAEAASDAADRAALEATAQK